jgi:hypothetical protein
MIIPHDPDPRQWIAPVARMLDEHIDVWIVASTAEDSCWDATSGTVDGLLYSVLAHHDPANRQLTCTCPAGAAERMCKHVAAVAAAMGLIDPLLILVEGARIKREQEHERKLAKEASHAAKEWAKEQKRVARLFAVGTHVRVKRNVDRAVASRTGIIEAVGRQTYRVRLDATPAGEEFVAYLCHSMLAALPQAEDA